MAEIVMPRLSDSMEEGTILTWMKQVGDEVAVGEEIVEIETDKANMAYEADVAGTLTEILAKEGDTLPIGSPIATIEDPAEGSERATAGPDEGEGPAAQSAGPVAGEDTSSSQAAGEAPSPAPPADETADTSEGPERGDGVRVKASPVAKRLAKEKGVDISTLEGSGPGGRIVKQDVKQAIKAGAAEAAPEPAPEAEEVAPAAVEPSAPADAPASAETAKGEVTYEELSKLQQTVARRMAESKATAPHFNLQTEIDMTAAVEGRKHLKELAGEGDVVPTFNDMVVKACALALKEFPRANGAYRDGRFELYSRVNVGVAVAAQ
ncbi:MAG: 2-oxo acid dehydrogenase subunit E2, partial [Thermoleophilia bacterium]|nr:2-oxo acid dehydrogenase subunit E2 [Thermoleophilia bacterium]